MGVGLDIALITGKESLQVRQKEMAVISNNIARTDQKWYHRQTVNVTNNTFITTTDGYYGTGIHISKIIRHYDLALELSLRNAISQDGYNQAYATQIEGMEDLIAPAGENHLEGAIRDFANALQDVATTPESTAVRSSLIGSANSVAQRFNDHYSSLTNIRDHIADIDSGEGMVQTRIDTINNLADQIADINDQIKFLEEDLFKKQKANDLRDERDKLVNEIAQYIPVNVSEGSDYRYTITVGGHTLVDAPAGAASTADHIVMEMVEKGVADGGVTATTLTSTGKNWTTNSLVGKTINIVSGTGAPQSQVITANTADTITVAGWAPPIGTDSHYEIDDPQTEHAEPKLTWQSDGTDVSLSDSGELKGLLDIRSYTLDKMDELMTFAQEFAKVMNTVHSAGFDLDGNPGGNLFDASTPGSMTVLISDPRKIAASSSNTETGNGDNARDMWLALDTPNATLDQHTLLENAIDFNGQIAEDVSNAKIEASTSEAARDMFQNSVYENSSVSVDEEMTDMLDVQRVYEASARLMSAVNTMINNALNELSK